MLLREHPRVLAVKRPLSGKQLLVDDGEAVLVAVAADLAGKRFRRRVERGHATQHAGQAGALQVFDEAEVGHFDAVADEEQVARLDVEVLQAVLLVHVIEGFGGVADVAEHGVARDADKAGRQALLVRVVEAAVGQLHHDHEFPLHDLDEIHGQDERVPDFLDTVEGVQLLLGTGAVGVEGVEVAEDELDGLEDTARRFALPDFAEAAASQGFDQAIAGERLFAGFAHQTHC